MNEIRKSSIIETTLISSESAILYMNSPKKESKPELRTSYFFDSQMLTLGFSYKRSKRLLRCRSPVFII